MTINVTSVNDAPAGTDNTVTTTRTTAYTFAPADFGFTDPDDAPAERACAAVMITTLPDRRHRSTLNGVAVDSRRRDQHGATSLAGNLAFHAGRQRQRHRLRQLHLPGAGRRRHRQRRRSISTRRANTITINVTTVNDAPAGTDNTVTINEDTGLHLQRRPTSASAIERQPGQRLAAVVDHHPAGGGHAEAQRRRGHRRPGRSASPTSLPATSVFTPAANANGTGYASFTFQVQDDGGTANGGVEHDQTPTR